MTHLNEKSEYAGNINNDSDVQVLT